MAVFRKFLFCLIACILTSVSVATAQDAEDHVTIKPIPSWVSEVPLKKGDFALADGLNVGWRVLSYQSKIDPDTEHQYQRFVKELNTSAAVEDHGTISLSFDPAYQTVQFHRVSILRGDKSVSVLKVDGFNIFRVETDRDKLIYNGRLQLNFAVKDLRVGDTLDYAYSVLGQNPALRGTYFDRQRQEFSTPYQSFLSRVMVHKSLPAYRKNHNNAVDGSDVVEGDYRVFDVSISENKGDTYDNNLPDWFYASPTLEISSAQSWVEVGDFFAPHYVLKTEIPDSVSAIVSDIAQSSDDPKVQARKALDYVQSNIRYLASELGETGFIPRPPNVVLARRFGDCKDVTFLLKVIMDGLGIEARPLLVHTDRKGGFSLAQPNHEAFDHVILRIVIDGEDYFMDATKDPQIGDLDHYDQGAIQKGLLLDVEGSRLIETENTQHPWLKNISYQFDLSKNVSPIPFKTVEKLYGSSADSSRYWLERDGMNSFEK